MVVHRRSILILVVLFAVLGGLVFAVAQGKASSALAAQSSGAVTFPRLSTITELTQTVALPLILHQAAFAPPASIFGVQMYGRLNETTAALGLARSAQVYWIRWPVSWSQVEPENVTPDQYDWTAADTDILNAVRSGHKLIVTIVSNPSWAATIQQGPIDKVPLSEYVQFVQALIERYDGDGNMDAPGSPVVRHWEFYNEPDSVNSLAAEEGHGGFWGDYGAEYAAMLCAVYPAAKAAHPATHVVFGGIAYDLFVDQGGSFNRQFLDDVLGAGGGNCFDVMNFHYYPLFAATWDPYGYGLIGKTAYLRNKLTNYGAGGKPFVVTEAGWHSDYYSDAAPGSDQIQSQYVVKLFTQASAAGLDSLAWWTWIDPSGGWWGANGLLTTEREPKVSFGVYQYAAQTIGQAGFLRVYPTPAGVEGYEFMSARQTRLYVFWARDGQPHALDLPASLVTVTSMYGDLIGQVSDGADGRTDGWVRFTVAEDPIYVEVLH